MHKVEQSFTALVDDNASTRRQRPRGPGHQSQADKTRQNRLALAESILERDSLLNSIASSSGSHERIDLSIEGLHDSGAPVNTRQHFQAIDDNIEEIERKMMMDAPKALTQEEQYKIEDIFDQSYKDLIREDKSIVTSSIVKPVPLADDDEFDVF
jgi:hypothetical protein